MEPGSISSSRSIIMTPMQLSDEEYFYKLDNMVSVSCEVLRNVFQARWKKESGDDWKPTDEQGKKFIKGLGKFAYQKSDPIQKAKIATGFVEDWDLCLLSLVILNLGDRSFYRRQNEPVRRLLTLRNSLAHHPTRKVTLEDYKGKMNVFRKSLKELGVKEEDIEKMIANAGVSCSDAAFKMAKKLYDKAKCKMAKNNFEKAIERCNEAIALPSLLPMNQSVTYENRAECYLKFALHTRRSQRRPESYKYIDQAIRDGTYALTLNKNSWKAHYLIGRCCRLNNEFQLAIQHLTSALAISPIQKQVKTEIDSCRADWSNYISMKLWEPSLKPETLEESVAEHHEVTGLKKTKLKKKQNWSTEMQTYGSELPGADDVLRGDKCRDGSGVKCSDTEAVKYYCKAADVGNPEGMVELGDCYVDGIGVPQDPAKGYELFLKVANMSPNLPGINFTLANKNAGVASAQCKVGNMYAKGEVVEKDYFMAAKWYRKAAENGEGFAAHNLANLYMDGDGVAEDEKMAELYWYQAVLLGVSYAACLLVEYYNCHLEPEKAEAMFKTAKGIGDVFSKNKSEKEFQTKIQEVVQRRNRRKAEVLEFEKKHNLDAKGLTIQERFWRQSRSMKSEPMLDKFLRLVNEMRNKHEESESFYDEVEEERQNDLNLNIKLIRGKAKEGSVLAAEILKTRNISHNLIRLVDGKETFSNKQKLQVLHMFYECVIGQFSIVHLKKETKTKLKQLIDELYEAKRDRQDEEEMKIRLAYVVLNYPSESSSGDFASELLKQGIEMYPDNVHYYTLVCVHEKDSRMRLRYAEIALKKWPDNVNLYYKRAAIIGRSLLSSCRHTCKNCRWEYDGVPAPRKKKEVVEAYEKFINKAPKDHRRLPQAYYSLAMIHMIISNDFEMMIYYYKLGKKAEVNLLPCFVSDYKNDLCIGKTFVENVKAERSSFPTFVVPDTILERRKHLNCLVRRWMITRHRKSISDLSKNKSIVCSGFDQVSKPKGISPVPERMFSVKPITIKQMALSENHIYEHRVLELTIIDVPKVGCCLGVCVHLIAEDEDGDVTHLNIYGMWISEESLEKVGIGARVAILHPHMQPESDPILIVNDDPDSIIFLEKVENMCCFCAESVVTKDVQKCGRCRKAVYCSKECQEHDWKIMKHKLICANNLILDI